jgi:Domain of unknown function (DUF4351)
MREILVTFESSKRGLSSRSDAEVCKGTPDSQAFRDRVSAFWLGVGRVLPAAQASASLTSLGGDPLCRRHWSPMSRLHWRDFVHRPNPTAAALMARMGMNPDERPLVKLECLRLLPRLRLAPGRAHFLSGFIDTYLRLNPQESLLFEAQADTILNRTERRKVMELTTSWKEESRQEGQVEMALRQLRRRCGPLPKRLDLKVRSLTIPELEALAEAVLDFSSLADFERWLLRR